MFYTYKLHYATAYGLGTTRESEGGGEEARRQHHEGKRQAPGKPMSMQCLTTLIYQNVNYFQHEYLCFRPQIRDKENAPFEIEAFCK